MIRMRDICVSFRSERQEKIFGVSRTQVLFNVSLSIPKGSCLGILGESGSGKSTLGRVICGLLKPDSGEYLLEGKNVYASREGKKNLQNELSVVFQDYTTSANPRFRIRDVLMEGIRVKERKTGKIKDPAAECRRLLELVGLDETFLDRFPHELSGGMCQRVIIAMAVCGHPKLIIADEPTTALDVTVQAQVLELLKDLQKKLNTAILLITHNLGVVWEMCDTVMVMYAGNTVEYADTKTLYQEPLHPYTWGLLDSMPKLSSSAKEDLKTIPGTPPDLRLTGYCCNFYNRCPYATEICKNQVPPLKEVAPGHFVACHRQDGEHRLTRGEVNETCRKM